MQEQPRLYIVEHMEEFVYDWVKCEYNQMQKYLANTPTALKISNADSFNNYADPEFTEKNKQNIEFLAQENEKYKNREDLPNPIKDYISDGHLEVPGAGKKVPFARICLLDMRAEKELAPEDKDEFDAFIFGGILGDHPPRDRTFGLRKEGYTLRHLGDKQM